MEKINHHVFIRDLLWLINLELLRGQRKKLIHAVFDRLVQIFEHINEGTLVFTESFSLVFAAATKLGLIFNH